MLYGSGRGQGFAAKIERGKSKRGGENAFQLTRTAASANSAAMEASAPAVAGRRCWRAIIRQKRNERRNAFTCSSRQCQPAHSCQPPPIMDLLGAAPMPLRERRDHYVRRETLNHDPRLLFD